MQREAQKGESQMGGKEHRMEESSTSREAGVEGREDRGTGREERCKSERRCKEGEEAQGIHKLNIEVRGVDLKDDRKRNPT